MKTENLETERKEAKNGTGTGIMKNGILEWNNKNFERRNREIRSMKIGKKIRVSKEIGKGKEESEKQSTESWNLIMDDNTGGLEDNWKNYWNIGSWFTGIAYWNIMHGITGI